MDEDRADRGRLDVRRAAAENEDFRRELVTGRHSQVVVMTLPPGEEIGEEVHQDVDQILVIVSGRAAAVLDGERSEVDRDDLVFVPAGTRHNFVNVGEEPLRLYTVYAPPEHQPGTVHRTKAEAEAAERTA